LPNQRVLRDGEDHAAPDTRRWAPQKGKSVKLKLLTAVVLITAGCTSINVKPVAPTADLQSVRIINNPKVTVSDFISVLQDGFNRHDIATSVVEQSQAQSCDVTLTHTALRSWDFKPYISHAELRLWRGGKQIGSADYHLKGKGGLSLTKWGSTKEKMDPVIDQLLGSQGGGYPIRSAIYIFSMADLDHPYRKLVILYRIYDPIIPLAYTV